MNRLLARERYDLMILDLMLPGEDGLSICRRLRGGNEDMPIIMLTAKGDDVDRIVGLEVGADDYVTKPWNPRELLARVKAVLRRASKSGDGATATMGREVQMGKCRLNLDSRRLFEADGADVPLTAMEFDLLRTFAEHPRQVLSRDRLLDLAHNKEMEAFDRSIDTRITRIRRKVELDPSKPDCIRTVRGGGYVYNPDCRTV
jgi:two-component system phosphate regulon response regulator OmpR